MLLDLLITSNFGQKLLQYCIKFKTKKSRDNTVEFTLLSNKITYLINITHLSYDNSLLLHLRI